MIRRVIAWGQIVFAVVSTPLALFWFAKDEPPFVTILSEMAILFTGIDSLWQAQQMEKTDRRRPR